MQAGLFSVWHLVWPDKACISGDISVGGAIAQAGLLLPGAFIVGLVFGYLFWRTGSLWAPMTAHFVNNTLQNFWQIEPGTGVQPAVVLSKCVVLAMALLAFAVAPLTRRLALPQLQSWGGGEARSHTPELWAAINSNVYRPVSGLNFFKHSLPEWYGLSWHAGQTGHDNPLIAHRAPQDHMVPGR